MGDVNRQMKSRNKAVSEHETIPISDDGSSFARHTRKYTDTGKYINTLKCHGQSCIYNVFCNGKCISDHARTNLRE